jgi:hypothetical protein
MSGLPAETAPSASVDATHVCAACGQPLRSDDDRKRNRFLWGIALAWLPFLPLAVALVKEVLRGISQQKATGIGAVSGGAVLVGVWYFWILAPLSVIAAFMFLVRSFSKAHPVRNLVATVSLCWALLMAGVLGILGWLIFVHRP